MGQMLFSSGYFGVEEVALQTTVRLLESVVAHGHVEHELDLVLVVGGAVELVDFPAFLFHHDGAVGLHEVDASLQTEHFAKKEGSMHTPSSSERWSWCLNVVWLKRRKLRCWACAFWWKLCRSMGQEAKSRA